MIEESKHESSHDGDIKAPSESDDAKIESRATSENQLDQSIEGKQSDPNEDGKSLIVDADFQQKNDAEINDGEEREGIGHKDDGSGLADSGLNVENSANDDSNHETESAQIGEGD